MKEDKLDKEIAASLKKKLVEATVPYELGAWESFQKMRAKRKRRAIAYWASGIAASLLLLAVGLNSVDISESEIPNSTETQLAENTEKFPENEIEEFAARKPEADAENSTNKASKTQGELEQKRNASSTKKIDEAPKAKETLANPTGMKALDSAPKSVEKPVLTEKVKVSPELQAVVKEKAVAKLTEKPITQQQPPITKVEEVEKQAEVSTAEKLLTKAEEPVKLREEEKFVAENDFPVIVKDKTTVGLGMGLSPGFGTIQRDNQVATAQTVGLGMLVDIKLPGKFVLGSGLGLNYLNQNAKQESTVLAFGNTYPQTEKLEVRQMQVEVPVFVRYPLTRTNSISVQAGFSNFYALNETASQENTFDRQIAEYSNDAAGLSSVTLKSETVNSATALEPTASKFYPFATLNFGLNLRVLETKGANYEIMPFYNYQLRQVSGYGDTYGLFGASFKMNFGGKEK